jgi:hypothetical protein
MKLTQVKGRNRWRIGQELILWRWLLGDNYFFLDYQRTNLAPLIWSTKMKDRPKFILWRWLLSRDANLIFSFYHLFAVISKLIDQPVWYLFKNDVFTLHVFGNRIQNKKVQNLNSYRYRVKTKASKRNQSFRFLLSFRLRTTFFL